MPHSPLVRRQFPLGAPGNCTKPLPEPDSRVVPTALPQPHGPSPGLGFHILRGPQAAREEQAPSALPRRTSRHGDVIALPAARIRLLCHRHRDRARFPESAISLQSLTAAP